jgi:hypothetical protein
VCKIWLLLAMIDIQLCGETNMRVSTVVVVGRAVVSASGG